MEVGQAVQKEVAGALAAGKNTVTGGALGVTAIAARGGFGVDRSVDRRSVKS